MSKRLVVAAGVASIIVLLAAVGVAMYFVLKVDLLHASAPLIQDGVVYYGDRTAVSTP